jgi:23S rRNA pseudouridine2605 synthase
MVTEPGHKVIHDDEVMVDDKLVIPEKKKYFLINKPKGYISVNLDMRGRPWVVDIIPGGRNMGLFPVGRLDLDTTGLMIITNDGDLANRISHPRFEIMKEYNALIKGRWDHSTLVKNLENGVDLENGDHISDIIVVSAETCGSNSRVKIGIHEGRKHVVKRIFLSLGSRVFELQRTRIGGLILPAIGQGDYLEVSREEIDIIFNKG